jgi:hypothetical protein
MVAAAGGWRAGGHGRAGKFWLLNVFLKILLKFYLKFGKSIHHHKAQT